MATSDHTNPQPKRLDIAVEEIAATLVDLLSSENVRAGMRLRSVRDLADIFGTDFWRVHRAIQQLTERGILAKRHGSGTFVRRVPVAADGGKRSPLFRKLKAQQILSADDGARTRRRPLAQHRHLDFQIWTDVFWDSPVHKSILQGVADVLTPLGHRVTTCGGIDATGTHLDKKQVEKKLRAHPADGYLVLDWVADSYAEQFNATGKLWLTFGFSGPLRHQPGMILDCMEAAERGTRALIEGGCRRVALLGYFAEDRDCDFERYYYMHALRYAGINDYQVAEFVPLDATQVRRALAGMLDSPHPPDGLYVADDNLLPLVAKELERRGIVPGRDLGVATLWNENLSFDSPYEWSRMEHSPQQFGRALAQNLIAAAQSANARLGSFITLADWKNGKTHLRSLKKRRTWKAE